MIRSMRRHRILVPVSLLCLPLTALTLPAGASAARTRPSTDASSSTALPTSAQVIAALDASVKLTVAPRDIEPPANAVSDYGGLSPSEQRCDSEYAVTIPPACQIGDPNGKTAIAVWGDSHAAMWLPALQAIADHLGDRLYAYTKAGCAPSTIEPIQPQTSGTPYASCVTFRQHALADIASIHPSVVLITGAFKGWGYISEGKPVAAGTFTATQWIPSATGEAVWDEGLTATLKALKPLAGRVVVIGDSAYPLEDQAQCLSAHADDLAACTTPIADAIYPKHNADEARIAKAEGDTYVPVTQWMCTSAECPPVIASYAVYLDNYHITSEFSEWLADALGVAAGLLPNP